MTRPISTRLQNPQPGPDPRPNPGDPWALRVITRWAISQKHLTLTRSQPDIFRVGWGGSWGAHGPCPALIPGIPAAGIVMQQCMTTVVHRACMTVRWVACSQTRQYTSRYTRYTRFWYTWMKSTLELCYLTSASALMAEPTVLMLWTNPIPAGILLIYHLDCVGVAMAMALWLCAWDLYKISRNN